MERVVIVLQVQEKSPGVEQLSISQLKDKLGLTLPVGATQVNAEETIAKVANFIAACQGSVIDVAVKVAVTDAEPSVTLSGAGSVARTFSLSGKAYV